ncbi:hypothetical protein D3C73_1656810 [compost metagenome]
MERIVIAVKDHIAGLAVLHVRIIMLLVEFTLHQRVGTVDLLIGRITVCGLHNDGSIHAIGDVG